ncbi:MAG: hypothetical protein DRH70_04830 [Candidatus Coatesbacteria bacterium]|nr:MAG: hypothetical protein DRH70_04830 [Candidatus Coatesbacteria bacterium]
MSAKGAVGKFLHLLKMLLTWLRQTLYLLWKLREESAGACLLAVRLVFWHLSCLMGWEISRSGTMASGGNSSVG